jgi:hypothetical protein
MRPGLLRMWGLLRLPGLPIRISVNKSRHQDIIVNTTSHNSQDILLVTKSSCKSFCTAVLFYHKWRVTHDNYILLSQTLQALQNLATLQH